MPTIKKILTSCSLLICGVMLYAQQATPYKPSRQEVLDAYRRAALLDSAVRNKVFRSTVQPNWQASGDGFWYVNYLGERAKEYFYVDANRGRKQPAFSTEKLAAALRKASGKPVTAADFPFTNFSLSRDAKTATIEMNGQWWQVNMSNYRLSTITQPTRDSSFNTNFRRGGGGGFGRFNRYSSRAVSPD